MSTINEDLEHQSEIHEIITSPPPWLIQWGLTLFFSLLAILIGLSALISYPDVVRTQMKIISQNTPKPIVARISGRIVKLLVADNQWAEKGSQLAYVESTGNHEQILDILEQLKNIQNEIFKNINEATSTEFIDSPGTLQLGELQSSYQVFYQSFLSYKASSVEGFYQKKRSFLIKDLEGVLQQRQYLLSQRALQEKEYELAKKQYQMHKVLFDQKVEAEFEFRAEEAKFLASQHPLQQTQSALLANSLSASLKEKEILELENQIYEARSSFLQALSSEISEIENWKSQYVLTASQNGYVVFANVLQVNTFINSGQELFYLNQANASFFGVMELPQYSLGKVKKGQDVLIKLKSFPYEEYGILLGKVATVNDVAYRDSVFLSTVNFYSGMSSLKMQISLKDGMMADAEIITEKSSLLRRLAKSVIKIFS